MKRLLLSGLMFLGVFCHGQQNPMYMNMPVDTVYQEKTLNAFTLYCRGLSTTTVAQYGVFGSTGIQFKTTSDSVSAVVQMPFAATDTVRSIIDNINRLPTQGNSSGGGWVATAVNGYYDGDPASMLTNKVYTGCLLVANVQTLTSTGTLGMSYTFPAADLPIYQRYVIAGVSMNATFAAGHVGVKVYDGSLATDTVLTNQTLYVSALDGQLDIPSTCGIVGARSTALRLDTVCDGGDISNGHMTIFYVITRQ